MAYQRGTLTRQITGEDTDMANANKKCLLGPQGIKNFKKLLNILANCQN